MAHAGTHPHGRLQPGRLRQNRREPPRVFTWRCTATSRSSRRWRPRRALPSFLDRCTQGNQNVSAIHAPAGSIGAATPVAPDPHARLHDVAADVSSSLEFFASAFGPPALNTLTVSPIPGTFGQGFPGLVYLSTLAYLDPSQRPVSMRGRGAPGVFLGPDHAARSRAPVVGQRRDYQFVSGRVDARSAGQLLRAAVARTEEGHEIDRQCS